MHDSPTTLLVPSPAPLRPDRSSLDTISRWAAQLAGIVRLGTAVGVQISSCQTDAGVALPVAPSPGLDHLTVALSLPHGQSETLVMRFCPENRATADVISELAVSRAAELGEAVRSEELVRDQSLLLEELKLNWKSLEALSEISSGLKQGGNPSQLAASLFSRARQLQEGLHLGLWMLSGDSLEPLVLPGTEPFLPDQQWGALITECITFEKAFVLNGRMRINARRFAAPLSEASHIAVVPIKSADGTQGALAFWRYAAGQVFDHHLIRMMQAVAVQAAIVLENEHLHRVRMEAEKLQHELVIGSEIQQLLLVAPPPGELRELSAAALSIPSQCVDGDFYDFIPQNDGSLSLLIGDVMGKGVQAALVGAATKISFLKTMGFLAVSTTSSAIPTARDLVAGVARDLTRQLMQLETFVCVCYAHFDRNRSELDFVNCGYPRVLHFSRATGDCVVLDNGYLPLGVAEADPYKTCSVSYAPGDVFLLCSDGVTDARGADGELFGEDRVRECLHRLASLPLAELLQAIREEVIAFTGMQVFADDFTCVAIRVEDSPKAHGVQEECSIWHAVCDQLPHLRQWISEALGRLELSGLDEETVWAIHLAVTEAFSNVARHAKPDDGAVHVNLSVRECSLHICMRYHGYRFEPSPVQEPPADSSGEGGFGLFLMSTLMDGVEHRHISEGLNQITMHKRLRTRNQDENYDSYQH